MKKGASRAVRRTPSPDDTADAAFDRSVDSSIAGRYLSAADTPDDDESIRIADWSARARAIRAQPVDAEGGRQAFLECWGADRHLVSLTAEERARLADYFEFVRVPAAQEVIGQDEQGDYLIVVLEGTMSVDRVLPEGRARLAEAHAGDLLGEMSLLDAGARFSACSTVTPVLLAVLQAGQLDQLMQREPRLALALLASLSRRLSLRLRQVSARLSALLSPG